jgi:hypothetical protein
MMKLIGFPEAYAAAPNYKAFVGRVSRKRNPPLNNGWRIALPLIRRTFRFHLAAELSQGA